MVQARLEDIPEVRVRGCRAEDFHVLLQAGFRIPLAGPEPLAEFLTQRLGIDPDYANERIQTIFLNGRVADDLACLVGPGDRLALSAALPGLVGATMRRGGFFARLREGISLDRDHQETRDTDGFLEVRLFNMLARELAAAVLQRGVVVAGEELTPYLGPDAQPPCSGPVRLLLAEG